MKKIDENLKARQIFSPHRFKLETLLLFWVVTIIIPVVTIFCLLNYFAEENREAEKNRISSQMLDEMEKLQYESNPEAFFQHLIQKAETSAGLPPRNSAFQIEHEKDAAVDGLQKNLNQLSGFDMLLFLSAGKDLSNLQIIADTRRYPGIPKPGARSARTILEEICRCCGPEKALEKSETNASEKMLKNFTESMFGPYFNPVSSDQDFSSGYLARFGGRKVFTARRVVFDSHGRQLFAYIAMFCENRNLLRDAFLSSARRCQPQFKYSMKWLKTRPYPFLRETGAGEFVLRCPISFNLLKSGVHINADLVSTYLKNGLMRKKPAIYPHYVISAALKSNYRGFSRKASFAAFLLVCLSILLLKSFHQQETLRISIRNRLFLSVFLATAMPAAVFIFFAQGHVSQLFELRKVELKNLMKSRLAILELSLKARDEAQVNRISLLLAKLRANLNATETECLKLFSEHLDWTFIGASLISNDGRMIEMLHLDSARKKLVKNKLAFHRDISYGSMIRLIQELGLMKDIFQQKLQSTPYGKKLLALAGIFELMDVDNFCTYEGQSYTSKQDFGTFRFLNFKLLPEKNTREATAAILMLAQDLRDVAITITRNMMQDVDMFRTGVTEGTIETALIGTFDLHASKIDYSRIWPVKALSPYQKSVLQTIARGKSEVTVEFNEAGKLPVIVSGKRIGRYPLIAVSEIHLGKVAQEEESLRIVVILNIAYLLVLMIILTTVLHELFASPINTLLTATALTGEGREVIIDNNFNNELAHLTTEFSRMSSHLMERQRLTRFISREAADTIAEESQSLQAIGSQKVKRTILFIHIRKFHELAEDLSANNLINLLNCYFPFCEKSIVEQGGQIDKYISDAVMAVFIDSAEHFGAARACIAAQEIRSGLETLNQQLFQNNLPAIKLGMGIATGLVISGRIGSYEGRLDYTLIGDRVNLSARLESMSHYSSASNVLVDEETAKEAGKSCRFHLHGAMTVKGKAQPVETYELIS